MDTIDRHNIHENADTTDRRLDLFFDSLRSDADVDVERIKMLTREKIRREQMRDRMIVRRRALWWMSAAAVVAFVVGVCVWALRPASSPIVISEASEPVLAQAGYTTLTVPAGERREITLSDGSVIMANARTTVRFPASFSGSERRIYADGEVYCRIARDESRPFIVESNGFDVKVLGTTFNIRNSSDSTASVVLVEGSVELTAGDNRVRMSPRDLVDLDNGNIVSMHKVDTSGYTSWTKGMLYLDGEPLRDVVSRIGDYYDLDVVCDSTLAGVRIYGKLHLKRDASDVLNSIQTIVPMDVERQGRNIIMRPIEGV